MSLPDKDILTRKSPTPFGVAESKYELGLGVARRRHRFKLNATELRMRSDAHLGYFIAIALIPDFYSAMAIHLDAMLMRSSAMAIHLDAMLMRPSAMAMHLDAMLMRPSAMAMHLDTMLMRPLALKRYAFTSNCIE